MTSPSLALPFEQQYFDYAQHRTEVLVPRHANLYSPDNNDDFNCLSVLQLAPEHGSKRWTIGGKRILIGIYRDEGREAQQQAVRLVTWWRVGVELHIVCPKPHYLYLGQEVELFNVNVPNLRAKVERVVSATEFQVRGPVLGLTTGSQGGYRPVDDINFYEDYVVYRLLPSFKLISVSTITQLLTASSPLAPALPIELIDPILGAAVKVSPTLSYETRGDNGLEGLDYVLNRQQFAEDARPLKQSYLANGAPLSSTVRYTKSQNKKVLNQEAALNSPRAYLRVFDYYGFELNDASRAPFYADDLVTYVPGQGLVRKADSSGRILYSGPLFDEFGNLVTGARDYDKLVCRDLVMPLQVDQFNVPVKPPLKRNYNGK